jgi:hypothetical protein
MSNISKIREKISALLKKTIANGASESEAMSAMSHASKLMKEHGVTLADIQNKTEASTDFIKKHVNEGEKNLNSFDSLIATSIAKYTDTKVWNDKSQQRVSKLMFFGYRVDVELAEYIREVCNMAFDYEWKKFSRTLPNGRRAKARKSFQIGMAIRISQRLMELKAENNSETNESRSLVIVKTQLVESAYRNMNMKLGKAGTIRYSANNAFEAGKSAAENVRFNRAVHDGPQGGVKMIA